METNSTETGALPIPFSRSFINFWMGWWLLACAIALFFYLGEPDGIAGWASDICLFIWMIQASRILHRNLLIVDARQLLVKLPILLTILARAYYRDYELHHSWNEITTAAFTNVEIIFFIITVLMRGIVPLAVFIYIKQLIKKDDGFQQ